MLIAPPAVNFGMLEDLLEEAESDRRDGKTIHIRVTTDYRTRSGGGIIGEETTVSLIATSCTSEVQGQIPLLRYGLWSWRIVRYAQVNGMQASNWTLEEACTLADRVVEAVMQAIEQSTGVRPRKGMYLLSDQDWLTIRGGTKLVDLRPLYETVKTSRPEEREA